MSTQQPSQRDQQERQKTCSHPSVHVIPQVYRTVEGERVSFDLRVSANCNLCGCPFELELPADLLAKTDDGKGRDNQAAMLPMRPATGKVD